MSQVTKIKKSCLRSERSNTDTSADEQDSFIFEKVFRSTTEWAVNHDTRESPVQRRIGVSADDGTATLFLFFCIEIATNGFGKCGGEVTNHTNMNRDVVFFRSTERESIKAIEEKLSRPGKREWMPLPVRDVRAVEEDVISSADFDIIFFYLQFDNFGRVLNNLGDVGPVTGSDFT